MARLNRVKTNEHGWSSENRYISRILKEKHNNPNVIQVHTQPHLDSYRFRVQSVLENFYSFVSPPKQFLQRCGIVVDDHHLLGLTSLSFLFHRQLPSVSPVRSLFLSCSRSADLIQSILKRVHAAGKNARKAALLNFFRTIPFNAILFGNIVVFCSVLFSIRYGHTDKTFSMSNNVSRFTRPPFLSSPVSLAEPSVL